MIFLIKIKKYQNADEQLSVIMYTMSSALFKSREKFKQCVPQLFVILCNSKKFRMGKFSTTVISSKSKILRQRKIFYGFVRNVLCKLKIKIKQTCKHKRVRLTF
jgi:hypothetical protein